MIKTKSPHYKTIPWLSPSSGTTPDKYILNIYVWSGLKASVPASPIYEIENINPLGRLGNSEVDISKYISEFIDLNLITDTVSSINDSNALVWVKTEVIYYISNVAQSPEFIVIDSAVKGYGYGLEGLNPTTPANGYLATTAEQKVFKDGVYIFNFLASESVSTVVKLNDIVFTKTATTNSSELIQSCYVDVADVILNDGITGTKFIEIKLDDVLMTTLIITDEPRYEPLDFVFLNKEGTHQGITLFKEKVDKLDVKRMGYENSSGQPSNGVHQFKSYNVNGRESFSMQSGFIKEDNNEVFTQFLLSEKVWILKGGVYIPVNLGSESLEYKTRQKDRLINYKIDFKYSFNKINNI
jgi:hypothetical protein